MGRHPPRGLFDSLAKPLSSRQSERGLSADLTVPAHPSNIPVSCPAHSQVEGHHALNLRVQQNVISA